MERTSGSITDQNDWFVAQNMMFTYSEEEQEENRIAKNNAALVLKPKFIPVYPELLHHGFSLIEATIFGFIDFFLSNNERFYCTNEQIAKLLDIGERSVSWAISHLEAEGLIKTKYRIKAWWGKIRFIEKPNLATSTSKNCYLYKQDSLDIYNKIIDNKISISNDIDNISYPQEKVLIPIKQKTHIAVVKETPLPGPLPEPVWNFLKDSYEKYPSTKYQIDKQWSKYFMTTIKDFEKLCQEYGKETVYTVLNYIKQDEFRCKQIQSIGKLRKKNKDWIPYIVVIMDKMIQTKANIIDLDSL